MFSNFFPKKSNTGITPRISSGGDFKDIVTKSTIFVDKSLFIKEAIENTSEVTLITMPRRSGKSANMDMLKRFLNIPVDQKGNLIKDTDSTNRKLFFGGDVDLQERGIKTLEPLKITKEKLKFTTTSEADASAFQGKYPVISIDFKDCQSDNVEDIKSKLKDIFRICFNNHSYLKNSDKLNDEEKQEFSIYSGVQSCEKLSDKQIHKGIRYLSELLYKHHEKKVWILIDEYDAAANEAYRTFNDLNEAQKVSDLFRSMFAPALKSNPNLEKGIITGVQYILKSSMFSGLNNFTNHNITNSKFSQYYGINKEEMEMLSDHFKIENKKREQIKFWYNGYKEKIPGSEEYIDKYNIWSIVNYLNDQEFGFKSYWEETGDISLLNKLFIKKEVEEKIQALIKKQSIEFTLIPYFSIENFETLKEISNLESNQEINRNGIDILFSYLFITGYLTVNPSGGYKLPNEEIRCEIQKKIIQYYKKLYRFNTDKIKDLTDILRSIIDTEKDKGLFITNTFKDQFEPKFAELIKECNFVGKKDDDKNGIFANEAAAHSILTFISFLIDGILVGAEIYMEKAISDDGRGGRADIVIRAKNTGIIIELKYKDDNVQKVLDDQAKRYAPLIENSCDKVFIVLNVKENKEVDTAVEVNIAGEEAIRF